MFVFRILLISPDNEHLFLTGRAERRIFSQIPPVLDPTGRQNQWFPFCGCYISFISKKLLLINSNTPVNTTAYLRFHGEKEARDFEKALRLCQLLKVSANKDTKPEKPEGLFDLRTEKNSADLYFQFYGYLNQQQNMLQDIVRTSTYQNAILSNSHDFNDKVSFSIKTINVARLGGD